MTRFLVVPQWQGSAAARAMLLIDGALAIAGDLPRQHTTVLDLPLAAGESLGTGIHRFSALRRAHDLALEALRTPPGTTEETVLIGGDRSTALSSLAGMPGDVSDIALIWCDARPGLHTPATAPDGALSQTALATALRLPIDADPAASSASPAPASTGAPTRPVPERGPAQESGPAQERDSTRESSPAPANDDPADENDPRSFAAAHPPLPGRTILVGARGLDPREEERARAYGLHRLSAEELEDPDALRRLATGLGATRCYIHVDVEVLDPAELGGVTDPLPFGARTGALIAGIRRLREELPLAGASLSGFAPRSPEDAVDDLGAILRLVGALA